MPVACCNLGLHQATAKAGGFGSSRLSSSRDTGPDSEERCGFNAVWTEDSAVPKRNVSSLLVGPTTPLPTVSEAHHDATSKGHLKARGRGSTYWGSTTPH